MQGLIVFILAAPLWALSAKAEPGCFTRSKGVLLRKGHGSLPEGQDELKMSLDLLKTEAFYNEFARFINAQFKEEPGGLAQDAPFFIVKHVLQNQLPWKQVFLGPFDLKNKSKKNNQPKFQVVEDEKGLGYFKVKAFQNLYAGNEETGLKLVMAYRIYHNVVGLNLMANNATSENDAGLATRESASCRGCHFENWYALDKAADVLSRTVRKGNHISHVEPPKGAKLALGDRVVRNQKELIEALVASEMFSFHACRLAFRFVYGRDELLCEGEIFDRCVDAFERQGMIQDGLKSLIQSPGMCGGAP